MRPTSSSARGFSVMMQFSLLCFLSLMAATKWNQPRWLYLGSAAAGLAAGTKYPGAFVIPFFLAGATLTIGLSGRPRQFAGRVVNVREAAQEAVGHAEHGDVAFIFGTEMSGLTNDELARCSIAATIPANPAYSSLNLAAAVQVAAYELRIAAAGDVVWPAPAPPRATYDEIEGLYAHAQRTLTAMAFLNPAMPKRLLPRLRRLFGRAALEHEEVNILRGILARIDDLLGARGTRQRR